MPDPLDLLLSDLAREYSGETEKPAAAGPGATAGPAPTPAPAAADLDDLHPELKALLAPEKPSAIAQSLAGVGAPPIDDTPAVSAPPIAHAPGTRELEMLGAIQREELAALERERARLRTEEEAEALRREVERKRQELEARRQQEAEMRRREAERKAEEEAALRRQREEERRRAEVERAIRVQAEQWLKKLDPYSVEGQWFTQFASKYDDRLKAAVDYLREIKGLG